MKNRLKTVLLLGALSGMLVGLGAALGGGFLHASLVMAALLNLGAWFFSDRIVLALSRARELPPVLAHEISHVRNRDVLVSSIAATLAAAVTWLAHLAGWFGGSRDDDHGASPAQALLLALTAPIAAVLLQLGISRSREYLADQSGAGLSGDPEGLARALEKLHAGASRLPSHADPATASLFIVNPLAGTGGVLSLFSTHPPLAERVRRLRAM